MEFFEKAHVSNRNPPKKDSKSEGMVKKQLKQMLYGYKQSDNELIKNSGNSFNDIAEVHKAFDDSTSVSGFSDLDLTKSDDEEDVTAAVASAAYDDSVSSTSDVNLNSLNSLEQSDDSNSQDAIDKLEEELDERVGDYLEPISEGDEDVVSLTEDTDPSEYSGTNRDISLLELMMSSSQSGSYSSDSDVFDPDGSLASKIMDNLSKNQTESSTKSKKRKLDETSTPDSKKDRPKKIDTKTKTVDKSHTEILNDLEIEHLSINSNIKNIEDVADNNTQDSVSTNVSSVSSPFISITATDMPDDHQDLGDILGDYKHPTVRILPCEKQNPSANNSGIFSTDNTMQVDDLDSLIPEIGEDPIVDDIEIDLDATVESEIHPSKEFTDSNVDLLSESVDVECDNTEIDSILSPVRTFYTDNACIFVLQHPAELYINGRAKIKPLGGTIEVFGHILKEELNIYSPNNNFAQCLQTVKVENVYYGLFSRLTSSGLSVKDAEEIVTSLGEYDGVIHVSPLKDVKMDFVDSHFSAGVFTKLKVDSNARRLTEASEKLNCNIYLSKPLRSFENYAVWDEAVSCGIKKNSRGIVCGGKGLGKSTFIRYYINSVLDKGPVLLIDLDPGQPEFTVAGCVSATVVTSPLLGPNFTHLRTPDISYNIGLINTMDNIYRYASAVHKIIEECRTKYSSLPWIVNTMGMTNHMGLKFILLVIIHSRPTFLVQIDSKIMKKRFECSLEPHAIQLLYENNKYDRLFQRIKVPEDLDYNFILTKHVAGSNKQDTSLSPRDERYLNFLACFGELVESRGDLLWIVPYEVNLSDLNIVTNVNVSRDAVLKVINGKIVALCQLATTDKGRVFTLQDNSPLCHGHALVRGVDYDNNMVYLLTPVSAQRHHAINALVYSDWAPELLGTERQLPAGLPVPYRGAARHKHKQHMLAPRRRFNPLQLLKMSRST